MSDTIRELIIQEFLTRAATLRNTASPPAYATDMGDNVFRARPRVDPAELPCCVIWPLAEEAEHAHGLVRHRMTIRLDGIVAFGAESPSVVGERMLGDLIKCFTSTSWDRRRPVLVTSPASPVTYTYLAPYAESIVYEGGGIEEYPEEGSISVGVQVRFLVTYWTKIGDPYNQ